MLTGSLAMNLYATPRMTRDIDLVIELKSGDVSRFVAAFEADYYVLPEALEAAVRSQGMFNVIHREGVVKVDCIVRRHDPHATEEFNRRKEVRIRDFQTVVISKEDLILAKLMWSRQSRSEMQARDIRALMESGYDSAMCYTRSGDWASSNGWKPVPMNDTSPEVEAFYLELLRRLTPEERFIRGALMVRRCP
jgi:hypothetical protein